MPMVMLETLKTQSDSEDNNARTVPGSGSSTPARLRGQHARSQHPSAAASPPVDHRWRAPRAAALAPRDSLSCTR